MAKKEFTLRGKTVAELEELSLKEFAELIPSRSRRTLLRGLSDKQKDLLEKVKKGKNVETHCRDMIIVPAMVGKTINVHNGKAFLPVRVEPEMLGHYLGEFALTRNRVGHTAPGVGASRSSAHRSVK